MKKLMNFIVNNKENIVNFIKVNLLFVMMIQGFWITYAIIWFAVGLPQTNWAIGLLYVLALLSEYGYYRWVRSDNDETKR